MRTAVLTKKIETLGRFVAFPHTVFALPFALAMLVIVHTLQPVSAGELLLILVALVSARSFAMAFNRIVDRHIDAKNPRTASRELPSKLMSVKEAHGFFGVNLALFFFTSGLLGSHCLILAPAVAIILCGYSYAKRVTSNAHFILGLALACAPGGVWYAFQGTFAFEPLVLMCGVLCWVAGFDIIYSCQDADFDQAQGLHSVPAYLGIRKALILARVLHLLAAVLLVAFGIVMSLGAVYFCGIAIFAGLLFSQHLLVSASDLSNVNKAFFSRNGAASFVFFLAVLFDQYRLIF